MLTFQPLTLPGAALGPENPLPQFRDPQPDRVVPVRDSVPPDKRERLGEATGFRVLPYRMQDRYTRRREPLTFNAAVLENEHLRAIFLPELGGRLISLMRKPDGRELLCRNPVFQPANLAIRNAWFSGGIEWNLGLFGHAFTTCAPLFAATFTAFDGSQGLRLYDYERCTRLVWQIDFTLPSGSPWLVAHARVMNPNPGPAPLYWWTNIAVPDAPGVRVLAPARDALYIDFDLEPHGFGNARLPNLPTLDGADGTYPANYPFASEFFFQCDETAMPWEAAITPDGNGFIEVSTATLRHRKLWCWGNHQGGRHWQEFLAPGGYPYIEIQAGLAPTQLHGLELQGGAQVSWTQVFGALQADPTRTHGADWADACAAVEDALTTSLSAARLADIDAACRTQAERQAEVVVQPGSGWGALEVARRGADAALPEQLAFPTETLGPGQAPWLALLQDGVLPQQDPARLPGEYVVQPEWRERLEVSLDRPGGRHWLALLHLGVMRLEAFDDVGAEQAWRESLALTANPWALRNLAALALQRGDRTRASALYDEAWQIASADGRHALIVEHLAALCAAGRHAEGRAILDGLSPDALDDDRVQIWRGQIALALGDLETVEAVLSRDYAVIREGENALTDLWGELCARREAARTGGPLDDALRARVRVEMPPPERIDFRMLT